jgi:DNA-binding LacI/PurR family transcriptional regulator
MAITIRDVALLAGTSVAAVSATLNGAERHNIRVGQKTRERIFAAAAHLNYTPNPLAQSLVTRKTGVLGLVFPYSGAFTDRNPFCAEVMAGVFEEVICEKYNLMLHTAIGNDWNAVDPKTLLDRRVDGLILVLPNPDSPVLARCLQESFPCVALVYAAPSADVCTVNADEFTGGRLAADHLIQLGHRRIAHLVGDPLVATTEPRKNGYLMALETAGISPDPALIVPADFSWKGGYEAMRHLLNLPLSKRPTALFAANDASAEGAMRLLRERGLQAPDDIAIVGYDDTWFATMTQPMLTSVHMPVREMAMLATQMLIALVEGRTVPVRQPVLPVTLTVRASCGGKMPG